MGNAASGYDRPQNQATDTVIEVGDSWEASEGEEQQSATSRLLSSSSSSESAIELGDVPRLHGVIALSDSKAWC